MSAVLFKDLLKNHSLYDRDVNKNIQKIGRTQTKNREVFKIMRNFNGIKLARDRGVAKFVSQNEQKYLQKYRKPPSEIRTVGISDVNGDSVTWFLITYI